MQNSSTMLLALFGLTGFTTYTASQTRKGSSSPSIRLPKLAMKEIELQKQDPSLPDWVVFSGDMGLKFYRAVCCPAATRH